MDVISMLHSAAAMFPSVSVVFGDDVEFHKFCNQYSVRSLPTVLVFKKGLLYKRYRGPRTVDAFAAFLSRWTTLPIRTVPILFSQSTTAADSAWVDKWSYVPKSSFDRMLFLSKLFLITPWTIDLSAYWGVDVGEQNSLFDRIVMLLSADLWLLLSFAFVCIRLCQSVPMKRAMGSIRRALRRLCA